MEPLWRRNHKNNRRLILRLSLLFSLLLLFSTGWIYIRYLRKTQENSDPFARCLEVIADIGVPSAAELDRTTIAATKQSTMGTGAREISANQLMELLERGENPGPRILHQSWKNEPLPDYFEEWSMSWKRSLNDTWVYVLWRDADNRKLVEAYYPTYLEAYDSLSREIYRVDMVRNMYMHRFGGIYADLDLVPLGRIQDHLPFLSHRTPGPVSMAYVGHMGEDSYEHSIPNAFMASSAPGHPFWFVPLDYVKAHQTDPQYNK